MDVSTLRRKLGTAALLAFRVSPTPLKRRVVRLASPSYTLGAVCVLEHEGEILVLWQPHRAGWSLPGGFMDKGETPADAVRREVAEEIGIEIDPGDVMAVQVDVERQGVDVIFRVPLARRPVLGLATEARKARWVDPSEIDEADRSTRGILAALEAADQPRRPGQLVEDATQESDAGSGHGTPSG